MLDTNEQQNYNKFPQINGANWIFRQCFKQFGRKSIWSFNIPRDCFKVIGYYDLITYCVTFWYIFYLNYFFSKRTTKANVKYTFVLEIWKWELQNQNCFMFLFNCWYIAYGIFSHLNDHCNNNFKRYIATVWSLKKKFSRGFISHTQINI